MLFHNGHKRAAFNRAGYMMELRQREKEMGIEPDPEIDAFMRACTVSGKRHTLVTELTLRILGLEVSNCSLNRCARIDCVVESPEAAA